MILTGNSLVNQRLNMTKPSKTNAWHEGVTAGGGLQESLNKFSDR